MSGPEIVALVVEIVHMRQAGVARVAIEEQLGRERHLSGPTARRLIAQVDGELQAIRHRMGLRLALSAEALQWDCVDTAPRHPTRN